MRKAAILVLDNDPATLRDAETCLRNELDGDTRVLGAESAEAALDLLRRLRTDGDCVAVLVANQQLPDGTGLEFLGRAAEVFPDAKRVLFAGDAEGEAAALAEGGVAVDSALLKPWEAPEVSLFPVVRELLDEWRAEDSAPVQTVRVVGFQWSPNAHEVKDFLARNRVPYIWLDVERDPAAQRILEETGADHGRLPLVLFPDGSSLLEPSDADIAERIGLQTEAEQPFYDLVIVGGGPAGLAAAVYGASEGLRTLIAEQEAPGGQAGQSARIENYLGFPEGLSGAELAQRAVTQAKRFGVEILAARSVTGIRREDPYRVVELDDGNELYCHTVLLATGVAWRVLDAPGCPTLVGAGIYYGAASAEAPSFRGEDVYVLGGGNSAGQAVMLLSRYARTVTMLVLEDSIEERMSQYLLERIRSTENIRVRTRATVAEAHGEGKLEAITIEDADTGETERVLANALFVFIGAAPRTDWLEGVVERDEQGYIMSGANFPGDGGRPREWLLDRDPFLLETSVPGIFVAGDVRAASVKRVASAVGEGSMTVQFIHEYLSSR